MNNKGFTLIELLATITIIAIIASIITFSIGTTLSLSEEKSYELFKNNIINMANLYITECETNNIDCNGEYNWNNNNSTSFFAKNLISIGHFKSNELKNPINGHDLANCLIINVKKDINNSYNITLDDSECN